MVKVLVVDDAEFFRQLYASALTEAGFQVLLAKNGKEAIDMMLSDPPQLVFLDLVMPEMTGQEVLKEMRGNDQIRDIPVVMLTSMAAEVMGAELLTSGPLDGYMTKDAVTPDMIVKRAQEILGTYEIFQEQQAREKQVEKPAEQPESTEQSTNSES